MVADSSGYSWRMARASGCQTSRARGSSCTAASAGANSWTMASPRLCPACSRSARSSRTICAAPISTAATTITADRKRTKVLRSVLKDGVEILALQALTSVQRHQFDQEREGVHVAAELRDEVQRRLRRTAGRQQVVHD